MIKIRVPATSANVGPGFDTLGVALNLYNFFEFKEIDKGLVFVGVDYKYADESNIIFKAAKATFEYLNYNFKGLEIKVENHIPISKGLGSSASCIIGGILGACEVAKKELREDEILDIALKIEGHPDNITPALLGGFTISMIENGKIIYNKINVKDRYNFYAFIPPFETSTDKAREILPDTVSMKDAVFNISRVSLLVASLIEGNDEYLKIALGDKLHQKYRSKLIDGYDDVLKYLEKENFLGSFVSGAGPTVIGIDTKESNENYSFKDWEINKLSIDLEGAKIINR